MSENEPRKLQPSYIWEHYSSYNSMLSSSDTFDTSEDAGHDAINNAYCFDNLATCRQSHSTKLVRLT